jgi:RNA polymerase sigma factor (sigma-70 family)
MRQDLHSGAPTGNLTMSQSLEELIRQSWEDLLVIAERERRRHPGASDDPASLLGEAMTRVLSQRSTIESASQLKGLTSILLRRSAIDRLRRRRTERAARARMQSSAEARESTDAQESSRDERACALADAMEALAAYDKRKATALTLAAGFGMDREAIAQALETSRSTVDRDLAFAMSWIAARLRAEVGP